jgi:hypothetical protein
MANSTAELIVSTTCSPDHCPLVCTQSEDVPIKRFSSSIDSGLWRANCANSCAEAKTVLFATNICKETTSSAFRMPVRFAEDAASHHEHEEVGQQAAQRVRFQHSSNLRPSDEESQHGDTTGHGHSSSHHAHFDDQVEETQLPGLEKQNLKADVNFGFLLCGCTYAVHVPASAKTNSTATQVEAKIVDGASIAELAASWMPGGQQEGAKTLEIIVHAKDDVHGKFTGIVQGKLDDEDFVVDVCGQTMRSNKGTPMLRDYVTCIGKCTRNQTDSDYF